MKSCASARDKNYCADALSAHAPANRFIITCRILSYVEKPCCRASRASSWRRSTGNRSTNLSAVGINLCSNWASPKIGPKTKPQICNKPCRNCRQARCAICCSPRSLAFRHQCRAAVPARQTLSTGRLAAQLGREEVLHNDGREYEALEAAARNRSLAVPNQRVSHHQRAV